MCKVKSKREVQSKCWHQKKTTSRLWFQRFRIWQILWSLTWFFGKFRFAPDMGPFCSQRRHWLVFLLWPCGQRKFPPPQISQGPFLPFSHWLVFGPVLERLCAGECSSTVRKQSARGTKAKFATGRNERGNPSLTTLKTLSADYWTRERHCKLQSIPRISAQ